MWDAMAIKAIQCDVQQLHRDVLESSFAAQMALSPRLGEEIANKMLRTGELWRTIARGHSFESVAGNIWRNSNLQVPEDYSLLEMLAQQMYPFSVPWADLVYY